MKFKRIVLAAVLLGTLNLLISDQALARSKILTTTILVNVIAIPKTKLLPDDQNADNLKELAIKQSMSQPYIKQEQRRDAASSGQTIYTITDSL